MCFIYNVYSFILHIVHKNISYVYIYIYKYILKNIKNNLCSSGSLSCSKYTR